MFLKGMGEREEFLPVSGQGEALSVCTVDWEMNDESLFLVQSSLTAQLCNYFSF